MKKLISILTSSIVLMASVVFADEPIIIGPGVTTLNEMDGDIVIQNGSNIKITKDETQNKLTINATVDPQVQADWTESDPEKPSFIVHKPNIPTVNNATLTIQTNGTSAGTFTANASTPSTINIKIPDTSNFVEKTGDTMTGQLTIDEDNLLLSANQVGHGNVRAEGGLIVGYPFRSSDPFDPGVIGPFSLFSGMLGWAKGQGTVAFGKYVLGTHPFSFTWSGVEPEDVGNPDYYESHGEGSFNANPEGGMTNFWIGNTNLLDHIVNNTKDRYINLDEDSSSARTAATVGKRDDNFDVGSYSVSIGNGTMQDGSQYEISSSDTITIKSKDENRALIAKIDNYNLSSGATIEDNVITFSSAQGTGFFNGEPLVITKSGSNTEIDGVVVETVSGGLKILETKVRPMGAIGNNSIAVGQACIAYGDASIASGQYTAAIGTGSHAEGDNCYAYGENSHANGRHSSAVGVYSHADGDNCYADSTNSYAGGRYAIATNDYAYAYGNHVISGGTNSMVAGRCAIATNDYAYVWNGKDIPEERGPILRAQAPTDWNVENYYGSHGDGTFNINPEGGADGVYIGNDKLTSIIEAKVHSGEIDPTVPSWAKESNKPTYTKSEVGLGNVENKSVATIKSEISTSTISSGNDNLITSDAVYTGLSFKYEKPSGGIPSTDLSSSVQTSLGLANSALQSETDPTVNNTVLTIQTNGVDAGTFTANSETNNTINIEYPDSLDELSDVSLSDQISNNDLLVYKNGSWTNAVVTMPSGGEAAEYSLTENVDDDFTIDTSDIQELYYTVSDDTGDELYTLNFPQANPNKFGHVKLYLTERYVSPNSHYQKYDIAQANIENYPSSQPWLTSSSQSTASSIWEVEFKSFPNSTKWFYINAVEYIVSELIAVTGVSLNKSTMSLNVNDSETLVATITPNDASDKAVSWSSSDSLIASVSNLGEVSGVAAGSATITVTTHDGGFIDTCAVTVSAQPTPSEYLAYYYTFETGSLSTTTYANDEAPFDNSADPDNVYEVTNKTSRVVRGNSASDKVVGTTALRIAAVSGTNSGYGYAYNKEPFASAATKLSFQYARYGTDVMSSLTFKVYTSSNGTDWTELEDLTSVTTTSLQSYETTFTTSQDIRYIKFETHSTVSGNTKRINIDEIKIWLAN